MQMRGVAEGITEDFPLEFQEHNFLSLHKNKTKQKTKQNIFLKSNERMYCSLEATLFFT